MSQSTEPAKLPGGLRPLLSPQQAAEFLGVSLSTLYAMIRAKEIAVHRFRGRVRIRPEVLEALLERTKVDSEADRKDPRNRAPPRPKLQAVPDEVAEAEALARKLGAKV